MKKENANYAVVKWAFWNGGIYSYHKSLNAAIKVANKINRDANGYEAVCVFPINQTAQKEIQQSLIGVKYDELPPVKTQLLDELEPYNGNQHYAEYCL